jgi:peptidoglycan/LPS O-acetylase OafA/YrhL
VLHAGKRPLGVRLKACDGTDAARGVLASIVFISHYVHFFVGDFHALSVAGSLAVLFFFAISGFVISGSLLRHSAPNGAVDVAGFAKRRFFRIVPPLIATLLIVKALEVALVFAGIVGDGREAAGIYGYHLNLLKAAASFLTLGAINDLGGGLDGPLWSLAYEIRCYVTAAVVVWLLSTQLEIGRKAIVVACLCAYWYVGLFIKSEGPLAQLPWFLSFAAGFFAFRYQTAIALTGRIGTTSAIVLSAGACFILLLSDRLPDVVVLFAQCLCGCAFAFLVFPLHGVAIRSRLLAALGGISYTLYIAHFPILLALSLSIQRAPAFLYMPLAAAAAVSTMLVCFALGRTVERPSAQLAWAERQLSRMRATRAVRKGA